MYNIQSKEVICMNCSKEEIIEKPGIDFVKLESIILEVCNNEKIIKDLLYATLRTTKTYCNCIHEYSSYLDRYGSFLYSLNIKDSDMVAIMYKKMLSSGYLSYNRKHKYDKSFKNIYNKSINISSFMDLDELEGCYITTGSYICRHMSSFLTDLEGRVGNDSYNGYVAVCNHKTSKVKPQNNGIYANHQITLIKDNNEFYGYCPTEGLFIEFIDLINNNILIGKSIDADNNCIGDFYYYMFLRDYELIVEDKSNDILSLFNNPSYKELDIDDLIKKTNIIKNIIRSNKKDIDTFYLDNKSSLESINNMIKTMVPKKNIEKLIIR